MNSNSTDNELAALAKALAHPVRVRIVRLLCKKGACQTGSLVDSLPLAQSTVSEHLRILREAGLVIGEVDGPRRCYCVDADRLERVRTLLNEF